MPPTDSPEQMVLVQLSDGNLGDHPITGRATKQSYGYRKSGDEFYVSSRDIEAQPHRFTVKNKEPVIEVQQQSGIQPPPPAFDFVKLHGINEERAEELKKRGVRSLSGLVALGEERLVEFMPASTAKRVIAQAEEQLASK